MNQRLKGPKGPKQPNPGKRDPLVDRSPKRITSLMQTLRIGYPDKQDKAAEALAEIGEDAVPYLIKGLDDIYTRNMAILVLMNIGDPRMMEPLLNLKPVHRKDIPEQSQLNGFTLAKVALIKLGEPVVEPLISILKSDDDNNPPFLDDVLIEIGGPKALEYYVSQLQDPLPSVKISAAESLGRMGDPAAVPHLISLLNAQGEYMKNHSKASRMADDPEVVAGLAIFYEIDKIAIALIGALKDIGDPRSIDILAKCIKDKNPKIVEAAIIALGNIAHLKSAEVFIAELDNQSPVLLRWNLIPIKLIAQKMPDPKDSIEVLLKLTHSDYFFRLAQNPQEYFTVLRELNKTMEECKKKLGEQSEAKES